MPGLPKGPFLENPVKRPDSIRGIYNVHSARGARYTILMIWVDFPFGERGWTEWRGSGKKARQNAIGGIRTHYMHLNFGLFQGIGHAVRPACRRKRGVTTVMGGGCIPYYLGVRPGISEKFPANKNFSGIFWARIFSKKI
jgi:hypothetical protein